MMTLSVDNNALQVLESSRPLSVMAPFHMFHESKIDQDMKILVPAGPVSAQLAFSHFARDSRRVTLLDASGAVIETVDAIPLMHHVSSPKAGNTIAFQTNHQTDQVDTVRFGEIPGISVEDFEILEVTGIPPFYAFDEAGLLREKR